MAKKVLSDHDKECPICGSIIWGKGVKVLIEGAKIIVCHVCAKHGTVIQEKYNTLQTRKPKPTTTFSKKKAYYKSELNDNIEIVDNYYQKIRKVRQSLGLNQDQFAQRLNEKPSLMRRVEAGKVEPTIKLAKKIEKIYNIKLLKEVNKAEASVQTDKYLKKSTGSSLGDIAFIKKKDKKS